MRYLVCFLVISVVVSCNKVEHDTSKAEQIVTKQQLEMKTQEGIITKKSAKTFEDTYSSLIEILTNNPNLKIIAELNHQSNASSVGLELRPTRIVLFGNPKLGTPLMQNVQTTGLDLPQKILVWEDANGNVNLSYNDPLYLKKRHGISSKDEVLQKVSGALDKITNVAGGL